MIEKIKNISILEWCLAESILFLAIWLWDPYIGKLMSLIFGPMFLAIVTISFIADKIDPSKISNKYYITLFLMGIIPFLIMLLFNLFDSMI